MVSPTPALAVSALLLTLRPGCFSSQRSAKGEKLPLARLPGSVNLMPSSVGSTVMSSSSEAETRALSSSSVVTLYSRWRFLKCIRLYV